MTDTAKAKTAKTAKPAADLQEMTEQGLEQAKVAYDQFKHQAEDVVHLFDDSSDALKTGATEFNSKAIEYVQGNINAGFEFVRKMAAVKDVNELVELQSTFARQQFDAYTAQVKELSEISTKVAERTSKPIADGIKKSFDQANRT